MRNNLVTIFHCADCGAALELSGELEAEKPKLGSLNMNPPLETGAAIRVNRISIEPCRKCKEEYTRPAFALAGLLKDIEKMQKRLDDV